MEALPCEAYLIACEMRRSCSGGVHVCILTTRSARVRRRKLSRFAFAQRLTVAVLERDGGSLEDNFPFPSHAAVTPDRPLRHFNDFNCKRSRYPSATWHGPGVDQPRKWIGRYPENMDRTSVLLFFWACPAFFQAATAISRCTPSPPILSYQLKPDRVGAIYPTLITKSPKCSPSSRSRAYRLIIGRRISRISGSLTDSKPT